MRRDGNGANKKQLKILYWNVAGIKNKDPEFWEFISTADIIILAETWAEEKLAELWKSMSPKDFKWATQYAEKEYTKGRAKGGLLTGIRKEIEGEIKMKEEGICELTFKWAGEPWKVIGVYNRGGDPLMLEKIDNSTNEKEERNFLLCGDFNARTGKQGMGEWLHDEVDLKRKSKDIEINQEGKELIKLLDAKGWAVMNGVMTGDEEGEHTFIGKGEGTVIDYGITNWETWNKIRKFKVEDRGESDHQPITIEIEGDREIKTKNREERRQIQVWTEETIKKYKENLGTLTYEKEETNQAIEELIENMENATVYRRVGLQKEHWQRNKWWNKDCKDKKSEMRRKLKKWKKQNGSENEFRKARAEFRKLCEMRKKQKDDEEYEEILKLTSEADVWKYIKKIRKKPTRTSEEIQMEEWKNHFMKLTGGIEEAQRSQTQTTRKKRDDQEITEEEMERAFNKLKKKKAPGEDKISNEQLIYANHDTKKRVMVILNKIWKGEGWPIRWNHGVISPIFKKGNREEVENYRGVTLLDGMYKLYAYIIENRLRKDAERLGILKDEQAGFRKGRGCRDNIYILKCAIQKQLEIKQGKLYTFFVDFKAAFDNVNRQKLWKHLREKGISEDLIDRIEEMYQETKSRVKVNDKETEDFTTDKGVRQGCPLSPLLFILYIADLGDYLKGRQDGGVIIGRKKIHCLAYADDVAIVATTKKEMENMIRSTRNFARKKRLSINIGKSKIVIFGQRKTRKEEKTWNWNGNEEIETVNEFKYLGYVFDRNGKEEANIRESIRKANVAMKEVWRIGEIMFKENFRRRIALFDIMIKSILMYGVEIWGYKERKEIEKIQIKYIKWILGLDRCTPDYIVLEETKRDKLKTDAGRRALKFEYFIKNKTENQLLKECRKETEKVVKEIKGWRRDREEFLEEKGWNRWEIQAREEKGEDIVEEWVQKDKHDVERERTSKIMKTRYMPEYRRWCTEELPEYLDKPGKKGETVTIARFRCGNECRKSRFWAKERDKECRTCGYEEESYDHIAKNCSGTEWTEEEVEDLMRNHKSEGKEWMKKVLKARKEFAARRE